MIGQTSKDCYILFYAIEFSLSKRRWDLEKGLHKTEAALVSMQLIALVLDYSFGEGRVAQIRLWVSQLRGIGEDSTVLLAELFFF